jgi:hypothetical protein
VPLTSAGSRADPAGLERQHRLLETTAMMPWCGTPLAMRSSAPRISKRSGIPRLVARRIASESRRLRSPFTISKRSKWRVEAASASSTGLMPQIRFMSPCSL